MTADERRGVLLIGAVIFFAVYVVGGALIEIMAWVIGLALFVVVCLLIAAYVRWLWR